MSVFIHTELTECRETSAAASLGTDSPEMVDDTAVEAPPPADTLSADLEKKLVCACSSDHCAEGSVSQLDTATASCASK